MASGTIDGKYYDDIPTLEDWGRAQGELADLQRQLQQAQETLSHVNEAYDSVKAQRDVAIERGRLLWNEVKVWLSCAIQFADDLDEADEENERQEERAKAAERLGVAATGQFRLQLDRARAAEEKYGYALNACSILETRAEAAERDAAEQRALAERLRTEIGLWIEAYGPGLIVYPSKEEIRAVNETPEFRIGRNAMMQVVAEGLQAILEAPAEALRAETPQSGEVRA